MHQVFISYNNADRCLVDQLSEGLEAAGYSTWFYDRDSRVGFNYMEYVGALISDCQAVVLLISPSSVDSAQVTREVIRASEETKFILPVLCGMTYAQFQKMAPAWRQALAGIAALELPLQGITAITPRLVEALHNRGIAPELAPTHVATALNQTAAAGTGTASAARSAAAFPAASTIASRRIMLAYKRGAHPDEELLQLLETELANRGASVFIDRHLKPGMEWAREIEQQIRSSDIVIPLLSAASVESEMLAMEVEISKEAAQQNGGKPYLVPVRVGLEGKLPGSLGAILDPIQYALWKSSADNQRLLDELIPVIENPPPRRFKTDTGDAHGAVPLDSEYYIVRRTDPIFLGAIGNRDSIVLIKGPRQMGKTSLLARGLQEARKAGAKVVLTDFQKLSQDDLESVGSFFRGLAELIAEQLDLDFAEQNWAPERLGNANLAFEKFIKREVLRKLEQPLVWGLDEVDRLFTCDFATQVFGLFRAWHNERSLEPGGPWGRLTMAIVHATEPHLFIQDLNQSPFNVGTKIALEDFTEDQVAELNRRYNSPLQNTDELRRFYELVGGHPFLSRRGLQELSKQGVSMESLDECADRDDGPFGDHLRRILVLLAKDPDLSAAVRSVLQAKPEMSRNSFFRLRSAGVLAGDSAETARMRCGVYTLYLKRQML
ncbi:MAG TPA: AAA-like domain-containing protein [Bryobacteraceae bacterium]|nr:AAA-like domain-containing protein [Bryobacteraceae bacterium]